MEAIIILAVGVWIGIKIGERGDGKPVYHLFSRKGEP